MRIQIIYIFKPFDQGLYPPEIVINAAGDIADTKAAVTVAACTAGVGDKTPAVLAGIVYNALGAVMAGSGPNYRLVYIYSGKADV